MASKYKKSDDPGQQKKQEQELLDDARFHINETETALDDANRASDIHQQRTGKRFDTTEENIRRGQFPEKDSKQ